LANWPFTLSCEPVEQSKGETAVKRLRQAQPERYCIRQPSHTENCCQQAQPERYCIRQPSHTENCWPRPGPECLFL